jgi:polysaccharide export outer membrane protein
VKIVPINAEMLVQREKLGQEKRAINDFEPVDAIYRIGVHDVLDITVWDHPELTSPTGQQRPTDLTGHIVQDDGTLFFPYVGLIQAAGKTVGEVREMLISGLSKYIENLQLGVRVIAYRSQRVYIVGEVKNPGIQAVSDIPLTIAEAINRSGGLTPKADLAHVTISRGGKTFPIDLLSLYEDGDISQNLLLKDGDVLNVPDRSYNKIFVLGEVLKPFSQFLNKGRMTLAEALSDAGGVNFSTANPEQIYVIRGAAPKPEIFHLDATSPDALILADRFPLQARDVVYVDTSGVARWGRIINQILPSAYFLSNTARTATY